MEEEIVFRPKEYSYWNHFIGHIGDVDKIFNGEFVYPRQFEIHLPGDGIVPCNFHCYYCGGKKYGQSLGKWEKEGLRLIKNLAGRIPFHIYAGSHTEPIINPYLLDYIKATKESGSNFGIHTNGSLLWQLEKDRGFLTQMCEIAEDKMDYLSISLDAGSAESHCRIKGLKHDWFSVILKGIRRAVEIRDKTGSNLAVRACYLMNEHNSSQEEIDFIVDFVKEVKVDSLRFSMPTAIYGIDIEKAREYKRTFELLNEELYYSKVSKHLINDDEPNIFWFSPSLLDVDLLDFKQCIYGYYQITLGADGHFYKCSTVSSPIFEHLRLGPITDNLEEFNKILMRNQDSSFDTDACFCNGARCNRMGTELNRAWRDINENI